MSKRTSLVFAIAFASVLVLWAAPAGAFSATSSPCDLIRSNLETVLGLPQVWERPVIGPHGKSAPDVTSTCKIEAWDASKPTSKKELDERIVRGSAAAGYVRTWVASPRSPDVAKWRDTLFRRTLDHAVAGCATLGKDPDGAKLRLPLDGAQSAVGYQGVNVGLDACGVWDLGSSHPSSQTSASRSPSARTDLADYRIITFQLQVSQQKPVADDLRGIARYLVGGFWHTGVVNLLHLYWTNWCTDCDTSDGTINEANLDGSNPHAIVTGEAYPAQVADDGSHLYWSDTVYYASNEGMIRESNLDGSNPHTIVTGQDFPFGVAVDASHIYWTSGGSTIPGGGTVREANLDGSDPHVIVSAPDNPNRLAINSSHLYWTDGFSNIDEANLDGSNPHAIVTGQDYPGGIALTSSHVYWADNRDDGDSSHQPDISEAGLNGSNPHTVLTSSSILCAPLGLATGANKLYWDNDSQVCDPTINQANLDGSSPHTLITGEDWPEGLVVGP